MADNLDDIQSRAKMADNLGPMAWLFLPENELPRKLHFVQKIHPDPKVIPKKDEKTKRTKNGLADHG
jgi:hypothetical protein